MAVRRLPVGIDSYEKLRRGDFYYVDKTGLIKDLLENWGEVNLFTRPRRFGKSLNISMLKSFFEIGTDAALFDGLAISEEKDLCERYLGRFPVISISLKTADAADFSFARGLIAMEIREEAGRMQYLLESDRLTSYDKDEFRKLLGDDISDAYLYRSLRILSSLLCKHFGEKVIVLVDEYDVPLQKAHERGYYNQMTQLISQLFGAGMKTNENMLFAVVTGCLRIARESIFTGFNNPKVHTITDSRYDEWFGFTDAEVRQMLDYYELGDYYETTREWYDGYRFGSLNVYCPWDVINWCDQLRCEQDDTPQNFWANTSSNEMVLHFVEMADETTRAELEELSQGKSIDKELFTELTYDEIGQNIDHLWSILFTTGYLTYRGRNEDGTYRLIIPNREIRILFDRQIKNWFYKKIEGGLKPLFEAFDLNSPVQMETALNACMTDMISFMDGGNTDEMKESFYHGLLLGMLRGRRGWIIKSYDETIHRMVSLHAKANREAGNGRADIILIDRFRECGYIIEVKYSRSYSGLEERALAALHQIEDMQYDEYFSDSDIEIIYRYGIAFYKRKCRVVNAG
ncbi:MAG: ATP-binding protein [Lachnospiraceae bacterium]|nr:ATP-binding protein [Lachnospiraceae bacterium]